MPEMNKSEGANEIARDVFDTSKIKTQTELRPDQIESCNKLLTLSQVFGSGLLEVHVNDFMELQKSKERKGLGEFVTALRSKKDELIDRGKMFLNNMLG